LKFATYQAGGGPCVGLVRDNRVVDIGAAYAAIGSPDGALSICTDLGAAVVEGEAFTAAARRVAAAWSGGDERCAAMSVPLDDVALLAPIPRPSKNVFCVGRNYVAHVEEGYRQRGRTTELPEHPQFFTKPPTAVIGPGTDVPLHEAVTESLDYEGELGVVIGRTGRDIRAEDALEHVFGYTLINDIPARDLQRRHDQWFKGKGLDGSCPMGPYLVHREEIPDPSALDIRLTVNGEERQRASTAQMIFDIPTIVAALSAGMTLEAGDVIATGTPSGVGYARTPPVFLADGDILEVSVQEIGVLRNTVRRSDAARGPAGRELRGVGT